MLFSKRMDVRFGREPSSGGIVPVNCSYTHAHTSVLVRGNSDKDTIIKSVLCGLACTAYMQLDMQRKHA